MIKHRLWRGLSCTCLKTNNEFKKIIYDKHTINMRNEWNVKTLLALINKHILSLKEGLDNIIKVSSKIGITCVPAGNKNIRSVCIKEYRYPSFFKRFLYLLHDSPARRSWFAAHGLLALNFLTPKPIALFESKKFGMLKKSFIIMEDISAWLPCNKYVSEKFNYSCDKVITRKKRRFISCLAKSFRQLHDSGIHHCDLKANNIIIMELQDTWDFYYLDLDRVYFNKKITTKKRIKNLSQLNASMPNCISYTDRLRFYRAYTGMKNLNGENKQALKTIIRLSIQRKHVWNPKTQMNKISIEGNHTISLNLSNTK